MHTAILSQLTDLLYVSAMKVSLLATSLLLLLCTSHAARERFSNSWAVEVRGGVEKAEEIARKHGFMNLGQVGNLRDVYHFVLEDSTQHDISKRAIYSINVMDSRPEKSAALQTEEHVSFVEQQKLKRQEKKDYVTPTDPGWNKQWAWVNTGQTRGLSGLDLNVEPVWMQGITGRGVVVAFVDDGMEHSHPDLSPNYDPRASWDFAHNDNDPTPDFNSDEPNRHGTSCAGEVGMAKDNGHCGVGVAYESNIGSLKMDNSQSSDMDEANALGYKDSYVHVYSNSWGPADWGFYVSGPGSLVQRTFATGTREGRGGKGSIYTWAAGNGGDYYDSCAADGYSSSIYTIAIGSADQNAGQADYDEQCAAKMAVTFSYNSDTFPSADDSWSAYNQIYTTTLDGQCTDDFTGTSAATPIASGVIALALQANPDLTWRDVQYLIAYTSNTEILRDGEWATNGAGLKVSHKFGFGVIDAEAMVTRAKRWTSVPDQLQYSLSPRVTDSTAANNGPITVTFTVSESSRIHFLEHVVVRMSLAISGYSQGYDYQDLYTYIYSKAKEETDGESLDFDYDRTAANGNRDLYDWLEDEHTKRGDIKIILTSPQGTKSVLLPYRRYDFINEDGYDNWPFMSVHHWGENPVGTWTLKVSFKSSRGYVRMSGLGVTLYGTATTPSSVSSTPSSCDSACAGKCSGPGQENCDVCKNFRIAQTLECVTQCPSSTTQYKKYCLGEYSPPTPVTTPTTGSTASPSTNTVPTTGPTTNTVPTTGPTTNTVPTTGPTTNTVPTAGPTTDTVPTTGPTTDTVPTTGPTTDTVPTTGPPTDTVPTTGPPTDTVPTTGPPTDTVPTTGTTGPTTNTAPTTGPTTDTVPTARPTTDTVPTTGTAGPTTNTAPTTGTVPATGGVTDPSSSSVGGSASPEGDNTSNGGLNKSVAISISVILPLALIVLGVIVAAAVVYYFKRHFKNTTSGGEQVHFTRLQQDPVDV